MTEHPRDAHFGGAKCVSWLREMRALVARPGRTTAATVVVLPLLLGALSACGDDDTMGAKPDLPSETPALWNPCDAIDAAFVKRQFGATATEHAGTPAAPECRFAPAKGSGQPAVSANYLLFPGDLDDAWQRMGLDPKSDTRTPTVAGADDARIVVNATKEQLYVTGFVQNGNLVQQVDVVDPTPFDQQQVVQGVTATLAAFSKAAGHAGVSKDRPYGDG